MCVKGKGSFYIAQYLVRWTAQNALHFCPPWQTCSFRHQLGFSGKYSSDELQLRAKTKSLTCPPLSIARYSFIQLSQLERQWRERKCPLFETVAKGDSNPGSLDCESGILPLSYRAPVCLSRIGGQTAGPIMTKFGTYMRIDLGTVPT